MNLSLILNMPGSQASAKPGAATPSQAPISPELASFQDFLAVVGLSPMAVEPALDEGAQGLPDAAALLAANDTGNILPPTLPVLPEVAASLFQPVPPLAQPIAELPVAAPESSTGQSNPTVITAQGSTPVAPSIPANPATPQFTTGQPQAPWSAALEIELVLPPAVPATPAQAAPQPVLAQLLGTAARGTLRKAADEAIAPPASATAATTAEPRAATSAPVLPVAVPAAIMPTAPDVPSAQSTTAAPAIAAAETPARHDFAAVIDKLAEARDLARPGRADMHLMHREFGQVSVQFELAGQALKVAMTSSDAAFAPAVQAALAERPITAVADATRADPNAPRGDTVTAANASWQAGPQADGQRGDGQRQSRTGNDRVQQQHEGDAASRQQAADRDGSRFA